MEMLAVVLHYRGRLMFLRTTVRLGRVMRLIEKGEKEKVLLLALKVIAGVEAVLDPVME
jgi:hypothetical protein